MYVIKSVTKLSVFTSYVGGEGLKNGIDAILRHIRTYVIGTSYRIVVINRFKMTYTFVLFGIIRGNLCTERHFIWNENGTPLK
jgi:hypothetical protein